MTIPVYYLGTDGLQQLRQAIRNLCKEQSTEAGALFPADNILLDFFINQACDYVVLDLAKEMPHRFLSFEDISFTANLQYYTLTTEWMQVWSMNRNVAGKSPTPIPHVPWTAELLSQYTGQTSADPEGYTIVGNSFYFLPTPSVAKTDYARAWILEPELPTLAAGGPTKIPRMARGLIPYAAMISICTMLEVSANNWAGLYAALQKKVVDVLGNPIQGQPRFIGPSFREAIDSDSREKAFFDKTGFFD